ncbi:hypothetical protein [Deinococcus sp.]|uniref:hypothetical protein n=1 Tax=Deinococcus sp. TaxID=47478 RepID=UPI0028699E21|nr:hypothetical protein [Deinococcus sp.]
MRVAAVRFDDGQESQRLLGHPEGEGTPAEMGVLVLAPAIHVNLPAGPDVTTAARLPENTGLSFQG